MLIAHRTTLPCPPSRPDLIVGPGSQMTNADGDWCCHGSGLLDEFDIDDMLDEAEEAKKPKPKTEDSDEVKAEKAAAKQAERAEKRVTKELKYLTRDEEGQVILPAEVKADTDGLEPKDDEA